MLIKPSGIIFILLFFLSAAQTVLSQSSDKDVLLLSSVSGFQCEDLLARLDYHAVTVYDIPGAVGYVVLYGGPNPVKNRAWELAMTSYRRFRKIDQNRFIILTAKRQNEAKLEFWLSKTGKKPDVEEEKYSLAIPADKPFQFAHDTFETVKIDGKFLFIGGMPGCVENINLYFLAEFLKANPHLNAHFLIHNRTAKGADRLARLILNEAVNDAKIDRKRLITKYVGKNEDGNGRLASISDVEVWLVRARKK